jgi:ATP-binding cassette subfamily B protein
MEPAITLDGAVPMRSLFRALRPFSGRLVLIGAIFAVKDSQAFLVPVITAAVIDTVVAGGPVTDVGWLGLAAALLLLQVYPNHLLFTRLYMGMVRQLGARLRNALTSRLQLLSIGYHARSSAPVLQTKVVRDVENIETMLGQAGNPALSAVVIFVGSVAVTAITVPQFLPIFALTVPTGILVWRLLRRQSDRRNEEFRREMEQFSRRVGEMAALIPITRAHGLEDVAAERVAAGAEGVRMRGLSLDMVNGTFGALSWVTMQLLSVGCLLAAGAISIVGWFPVSPGQVVLLGTYFTTLTGTVLMLLNLIPLVAKGRESVRSLAEVLQEPDLELNEGKQRVSEVTGHFSLRHVTVRYEAENRPALDDVSLEIAPGETVAFVGSSGSGKSTLMNTILGFVRPSSGQLLLDGADTDGLDLRSVRRFVSVVPQESVLFEGSIRENITYGLGSVNDERVRQVLDEANATDIVAALPQGWDISIARALIRDPRVLLLDEATSALDSESEAAVQVALQRLMRGRTTLVVAHRLSTVRDADRIVVLEHGRIVESGTHDALVEAGGRYAALWGVQRR